MTVKKCSICDKILKGYGNNARPINNGICCDNCNSTKVIPIRIDNVIKIYQQADKDDTNPLANLNDKE